MKIKARWRFADEAPRIGCGERGVVITLGPRWAQFEQCSNGKRGRIPAVIYDRLKDERLIRIEARL